VSLMLTLWNGTGLVLDWFWLICLRFAVVVGKGEVMLEELSWMLELKCCRQSYLGCWYYELVLTELSWMLD